MDAQAETAYREYVVTRMDGLRRTAYLMCQNWHTADDLVSTTLTNLYRKWRRAQEASNLDAYVRRILLNTWIDEQRRPWRRETLRDNLPDVIGELPPVGDQIGLAELLQRLSPRYRAVLVLRFYCDVSVDETAEILGLAQGTVKTLTARGLASLRAAMTNAGVHE